MYSKDQHALDLDKFKLVNDTYGHNAGDQVLQAVTRVINKLIRDYDLFARIGGEEFAILLPATEAELGYVIAERIRSSVESLEIPFEAQKLAITTSIGMVENSKEITSFEQMILLADKHLNQAKLKGRNTVLYT